MSSNYALIAKEPTYWDDELIIGTTHAFNAIGAVVSQYLPDDTPIVCVDNDTDINTIGELKAYYKSKP